MKKRFLATLLTLCMAITAMPISGFAKEIEWASTSNENGENIVYFSEDDAFIGTDDKELNKPENKSLNDSENINVDSEIRVGENNLIQLATPTELKWGLGRKSINGEIEHKPGAISWKIDGAEQGRFQVKVYLSGQEDPIYSSIHNIPVKQTTYFYEGLLYKGNFSSHEDTSLDSGDYYFTVQSLGDGKEYSDSPIATSEIWRYTKPDKQLDTISVSGLKWKWPKLEIRVPNDTSNITGYAINYYFSENGTNIRWTGGYGTIDDPYNMPEIPDEYLQRNGNGYYYFKVCAVSKDITQYQSSEWSELSPAYNLNADSKTVADSLKKILESTEVLNVREEVKKIDRGALRSSMLADSDVLDLVDKLEKTTGVSIGVDVKEPLNNDFPENDVKIVGAALNDIDEGTNDITLQIDKPQKTDLIIPERYNSTLAVEFSMGVNGVENADQGLSIPIRITLPIPETINPDFLSILHYPTDGEPEILGPTKLHIYKSEDNNKYYVSFVLDHFSDFIMTEIMPVTVTFNANEGICGTETISVNSAGKLPELPMPTRKGYTFKGWYMNGAKIDENTIFTENTTVIAEWSQDSGSVVDPPAIVTGTPVTPTTVPSGTPSENETPTVTPPPATQTPIVTPDPGTETPSVSPTPPVTTVTPTNTPIPTNTPTPGGDIGSDIKVKELKITGSSKKIAVGKKLKLKATVSPANPTNKAVTWKTSNNKYATVNSKGIVTIKKAAGGKTVTITATAKDGSGIKANYKIQCMKGIVKKVTISGKKTRAIKAGKSIKLKAKVNATKGANKTLKWSSSNTKYATVNSKGKVTTKKAGKGKTIKITATATDGSGKKATVKIKLK